MIVTDRFVFIHMHKTGGQTLSDVITDCISSHRIIGYHFPKHMIPQEYADLPIVGLVRNPWSWYVSWYSFNRQPNIRNSLFHVVSEDGRLNFVDTVSNLVELGSGSERSRRYRERLASLLPDTLDGNRGVGLTRTDIHSLGESDLGYYSWLFDRMLGIEPGPNTLIGRFENLREDFLEIMTQLDVPEIDSLTWAMDYGKRKNSSRHSHYSHYFNDQLRQLVAGRESTLIERFAYQYQSVGPAVVAAGPETDSAASGFQKLLGRADNYLQVNSGFKIGPLRDTVLEITDEVWSESKRDEYFHIHRDTQAVTLVEFVAHKYEEPLILPVYEEFEDLVRPVVDHIADFYQDNGFVVRILLAKLRAGGRIDEHVDTGYSLLTVHRIHVPLVTNDDVAFFVGGERKYMRTGEFWEIDNSKPHAVNNAGGEDRIHMIVDWMPNPAGGSVKAAIDKVKPVPAAQRNEDRPVLDEMLARAFEFQREGKLEQAETKYRYVLDIDPNHAVCNNLMGMLCRQLRRYDEAVQYIRTAIRFDPGDAKAHANLGQAYLMKGDFAESAQSFQKALSIDSALESARVGLHRAQLESQKIQKRDSEP